MALFHLSVKYVSRNQGRSAVAAAAYRSGQRLYDQRYGLIRDYSFRRDIVHTEILLPKNAPQEFLNREFLWNEVERSEKRVDSRVAREVEIALPNERQFSQDKRFEMVKDFVIDNFINWGMCGDICIHDKKGGNPHAHILLTTRLTNINGFDKKKNRDWDKRDNVNIWREQWAEVQNREYDKLGLIERVSHKSYAVLGIDREPTKHRGPKITALERMGIQTDRSRENFNIEERNKERDNSRIHIKERNFERAKTHERTR